MKVIFGTAKLSSFQYGYGSKYKTSEFKKSYNIIKNKIKIIELSKRYNLSLITISKLIRKNYGIKIHYKIDGLNLNKIDKNKIYNEIKSVIKLLKIKCIDVLYLHQNEINIISNKDILKILTNLKEDKLVKNIGCTIYSKKEFNVVKKLNIFTYFQIPVNITDTYLYNECVKLKKNKNIKIVARSVFLQGTLLNNVTNHKFKKEINEYKSYILKFCIINKIKYHNLLLYFIKSLLSIDYIIMGSINYNNINTFFKALDDSDKNVLDLKEIYKKSKVFKNWNNPKNW